MPRTDPKYLEIQTNCWQPADEKVIGKISKLFDGECLGYYKTKWMQYVAIVKIGDRYEFCQLDNHYIKPDGYNSWGFGVIDYFRKDGRGHDSYFEHSWYWINAEAISSYFEWLFKVEDEFYVEELKEEPKTLVKKSMITKPKKKTDQHDDGQMDIFEFVS